MLSGLCCPSVGRHRIPAGIWFSIVLCYLGKTDQTQSLCIYTALFEPVQNGKGVVSSGGGRGSQVVDETAGYGLTFVQRRWLVRRAWVLASLTAASWVVRTWPLHTHSLHIARYAWLPGFTTERGTGLHSPRGDCYLVYNGFSLSVLPLWIDSGRSVI